MVAIKGELHHPHEKESESLRHRSLIKFVFFCQIISKHFRQGQGLAVCQSCQIVSIFVRPIKLILIRVTV